MAKFGMKGAEDMEGEMRKGSSKSMGKAMRGGNLAAHSKGRKGKMAMFGKKAHHGK